MPLDAICISALTEELKDKIEGGRIDKVQQPERDMLILSLRNRGESYRLLLSACVGSARVQLTDAAFENPAEPPMFCMLLRKYLTGARIASVHQPDNERMIVLELDSRDELGYTGRRKLIAELIGKSSNLILTDEEGRITDCIRRMDFGGDALRRMLPGMLYRMPPKQTKPFILHTDSAARRAMIASADRSTPPDKWLLGSFSGLSPLICRELAYRSNGDYDALPYVLDAFCESVGAGEAAPYMISEDGKPIDYSFMPITQYGAAAVCERAEDFSALLDSFYSRRDRLEQQRRKSRELMKTVKTLRDRQERKLAGQAEELQRTEGRETIRRSAELITANIYRMKRGDRVLVCEDYYEPDCPEVTIPLDALKTPQQNAAALYKEYNKLKAAREHLSVLIADGQQKLDYLNSMLELIAAAETERDISDLRRELTATGWLKKPKNPKPDKVKTQAPRRFVSDDGFEILVGRSNLQNDELTTRIARRTDYWLHTQKLHGSHVIIRCDGQEPPERTVQQAASLAVYYSQGRDGGKSTVDITIIKNVRKPSGALPGRVIYTDYRTVTAESSAELAEKLKH